MKKYFIGFLVLIVMVLVSCDNENDCVNFDLNQLYKSWAHDYESDSNSDLTTSFRLYEEEQLSGIRFLQTYEFFEHGLCKYSVLAANDAHYFAEGKWELDSESCYLSITGSDSLIVADYSIVELTNEKLVLKQN